MAELTKEEVIDAIRPVIDPDIFLSIVDLGLIYDAHIEEEGRKIKVEMTLTSPACPAGPQLIAQTKFACEALPGVHEARVEIVWEPPWDPRTMASDEVKDILGIWD